MIPIRWLKVDVIIQGVLFISTVFCGIMSLGSIYFLMICLILQFFLGCWQVLTAIVLSLLYNTKERYYYLLAVAAYFIGLFIILENISFRSSLFSIGILYGLIVPWIYALYYWNLVINEKQTFHLENGNGHQKGTSEILDSGF